MHSEPVTSSKGRIRVKKDPQPSIEELQNIGIKVRDFAYEKTSLPPVHTIYRHPRQFQPSVTTSPDQPILRSLKHKRTETDEEGLRSKLQTIHHRQSQIPLEKTEPAISITLTPGPLTWLPAYLNMEEHQHDIDLDKYKNDSEPEKPKDGCR
jgi:hypothetical protein